MFSGQKGLFFVQKKSRYNKVKNDENKTNLRCKSRKYEKTIHKHHSQYVKSKATHLRSLKNKDPKKFWRYVTKNEKSKCRISKEAYFNFMKDLNDTGTGHQSEQFNFDTQEIPDFNFINDPITVEEIKSNTANLSNGKSIGLDKILNEHIKSSLHIMLPIYNKYFNLFSNNPKVLDRRVHYSNF